MIDLSFLTEEEQEAIMKVLQRDAALKRTEEERVRHLPEKVKDDQQLKNMSGQWFYEAKAKRHRDKIHGADIIRASMRKKRLQVTAEQSQDKGKGAKDSWVNNVNKDALLPPELAGVTEEPEEDAVPTSPSSSVVNPASTMIDIPPEHTRTSAVSPAKERKNPFNSSNVPEDHLSQQTKNEQPKNGRAGLFQPSKEGKLSASKEKSSIPDFSSQILEKPKQPFPSPGNGSQIKTPVPKARKMIYKSHDLKQEDHQSFPRHRTDSLIARGAPRGILKRNSSSSSTDSETARLNQNLEPKSKVVAPGLTIHERISEKEPSLDGGSAPSTLEPLKHVRFSATKDELPQSPGLILGREVGEFSVLESDKIQNAAQDMGGADVPQSEPESPQHGKPLLFDQPVSNSSASQTETHQPQTSGSFSFNGPNSDSPVSTARPQSFQNSLATNEYKAKRLQSDLSKSPAGISPDPESPKSVLLRLWNKSTRGWAKPLSQHDELPHRAEPEPSQVPARSSRDHQQGKPALLTALIAKTSSSSGANPTEIMKTTDDSISKVLDWFNRSSHSDDNKASLKHPRGRDPKGKTGLKSQTAIALVPDDIRLKEKGSKALSSPQGELKPVGSDSTSLEEEGLLLSGDYQKNDVNIKMKSLNLSQQGTPEEGLGTSQPFESCGSRQGSENVDKGQRSECPEEETLISPPASQDSFSALSRSSTRDQVPRHGQVADISKVNKSKPQIREKTHSEMDVDSFAVVREPSLKDNMKAEGKSKGRDVYVLKASLEAETTELPPGTERHGSPCLMAEVELQQEASELPNNQVLREKYKRVSDRISFWEGEKAAAKLTYKDPTSSRSQNQPSADPNQPVTSLGVYNTMSPGQCEDNQDTMKPVFLGEGGPASRLSNSSSSSKPKETKPPKPEVSSEKEPIATFPGANSLHPGRAIPALALQRPLKGERGMSTPLEKDRSGIGGSKPNFTVLPLKERMDEANTEQVYDHSQFQNLKKFWDLGADSNRVATVEKKNAMTSPKTPLLFSSQKCQPSGDFKSPGENTREVEALLNRKKVPAGEDIEKVNSKVIPQVLPEETTFLRRPPRASIHQLPGNELSKENLGKNTGWPVSSVIQKEQAYSGPEIEELVVKTSVLPREDRDAFHDSLQKLLAGASSPATQPSREKSHVKQELEPGFVENRTWCSKTADAEEEARQPKEIISEHVDKTVAPPKVEHNTFMASLDRLLKETSETSLSPGQTELEPVATGTNAGPEESRFLKKVMEKSHNILDRRDIIAPFLENEENSGTVAAPQGGQSGERRPETERSPAVLAETTRRLLRKGALGEEVSSPQDKPFSQDAHFAPQDRAVPPQKEISETVERVILPPKAALNDINAAFQKLLGEAQLSHPAEGDVVSGDVKPECPEGGQAAGSTHVSQGVIVTPRVTTKVPDINNVSSFHLVPDKPHLIRPYGAPPDQVAQMSPSEQNLPSCGSAAALDIKELPQVGAGVEKQMEEIVENAPSEYEGHAWTVSPSKLMGSAAASRQAASAFLPKEVKETVEKSEAPSKAESAFDIGLEKLLEEIAAAPHQLPMSVEEEIPETSPGSEKAMLSTVPHFHRTASETSDVNAKSNDLKSQGNHLDKDSGTGETIDSPGTRHRESAFPKKEGSFQAPGFQQAPEAICGSGNQQPIPHLMNQENSPKASKVKLFLTSSYYKRQEKEEEGFTDSEFSDGNISSNAESWRNASSSEDEPSPVLKSMERSAPRKMPSKSLEDISSDSSSENKDQAKVDTLPEELVRSAEDDKKADQQPDTNESLPGISTVPSQPGNPFSHPDKLKRMSKSVPAFLQDESDDRETDTASESSYQLSRHRKSPSSLTNLSSSSGMTSLSSVSGSVMSVYSGDFGNLEVKGNIQFAIDYVDSLKELHVFVAQCKDLAAADVKKQRSDPYVKTYLLPDKGKMGKKKTFVLKKTLNPVYNEILRYKIEKQTLKTQKLNVSVWHRDTFKRNSFLGEVELDLETWDWDSKQNQQLKWYPLKRKTAPVALEAENRGEMKLALQYVPEPSPGKKLPTTGEVHIWVKECLDLPVLRGSHLNSFVKCTILPDTSRKSRQKTRAVGKTNSPVFNHTMVYDGFRPEDLTEACVELTVWDHYKLTNQFLGGLRIGFGTGKSYGTEVDWMDSTSEEVALWEKMVESPNTWIEATLPLRMLLIAKISK